MTHFDLCRTTFRRRLQTRLLTKTLRGDNLENPGKDYCCPEGAGDSKDPERKTIPRRR